MKLEFVVSEPGSGDDPALSLESWLKDAQPLDVVVAATTQPGDSQHMDAGSTILTIVLGSKAVVELAKGIHTWLRSRQNDVQLKSSFSDGTTSEVSIRSTQTVAEIAEALEQLKSGGAIH